MASENTSSDSGYDGSVYDSSLESPAAPQAQMPTVAEDVPRRHRLSFRRRKTLFAVNGAVLLLIIIIGLVSFFLTRSSGGNGPINAQKAGNATNYAVSSLPVNNVKANQQLQVGEADHLTINGQVIVGNTLVLAPTATPTSPTAGQIYYNQSTNAPYYYNGTQFISLAPTTVPQHVTSIGGVAGSISVGNGLQVTNGQLSATSTAQTLTGGKGIAVNGTTINNQGLISLAAGTANLVVSQDGNGNYTLSDNSVVGSGSAGEIALFTGGQTLGGSILSQSGNSLIDSGDLTVSGAISTNTLQQTGAGNNLNLSAGNDSLVFTAGGRTFEFPTSGPGSQVICTTGISCASGGGQAVILQPGSAQLDTGSSSSIFVNNTGGGNLLELQGAGSDRFVVTNSGNTTIAGTLAVQGASTTIGTTTQRGSLILNDGNGGSNKTATLQGVATLGQNTTYTLPDPGQAAATICLSTNNCTAVGGAGGDLTGSYPNPTIAKLQGSTLTIASPATGQILQYNGSAFVNQALSGDVTINGSGVTAIGAGKVTNVDLVNSSLTVTAGNGLNGGGSVSLGGASGGLNVTYGSTSNTAVQGNTSLTCPAGSGNLSGGGNSVTLGAGGTCNSLTAVNSPTFSGTLAVQGAGGITVGVAGSTIGSLNLANGSSTREVVLQGLNPSGSGNATVQIPTIAGGATDTVCLLSLGNCVGTGGGITGGGTIGNIAKFSGTGSIANSTLSESGSTLTASGNVVIQGSNSLSLGVSSSNNGSISFANTFGSHTVTLQAPSSDPLSNLVFKLPSSYGSNGSCLQSDGTGGLVFTSCTGGVGGGVTSLDGQAGLVTLNNSSGSGSFVTINNAKADGATEGIATFNATNFTDNGSGVINTAQNIAAGSAPTFSALTLQGANALTLGTASTNTGAIVFQGSGGAGTLTLQGPTTPNAGNFTLSIPAITGSANICTDNSVCTGYAATSSLAGYVQLQGSTPGIAQTGNLNISGTAIVGALQSAASQPLNITGNAASTISTSAGNLTVQAAGTNTLVLDTGGAGTVSVGNANATTIQIGNTTSAVSQAIKIGNNTTAGSSTAVTLGSTMGTSPVTIQGGTSGILLKPVNTVTALQVADSANNSILNVDTTSDAVTIGTGSTTNSNVFSDGFESGNFGAWTSTCATGPTINTGTVHGGINSAQIVASASNNCLKENITSQTTYDASGWFNIASTNNKTSLLALGNTGAGDYIVAYRDQATGHLFMDNGFIASATDSGVSMSTGAWHKIEIKVTVGSPGTVSAYLDGVLVLTIANQNIAVAGLNQLVAGDAFEGTPTVTMYMDDIGLNTPTATTSLPSSLTVNGTATVIANSTAAFQVQNAAGVAALNVNTSTLTTTLQAGTDTPTLGSENIAISDFCNAAWTTTNWTLSPVCPGPATTATHVNSAGNVSPLTTSQFTPTNGTYQVTYTISGTPNAGTLTVTMGGAAVATYNFNGVVSQEQNFTETRVVTTTTGAALTFTPSSTFVGTISAISVKAITLIPSTLTVNNVAGNASIQVTASSSTSNSFIGQSAGMVNSSGINNLAFGTNALKANTTGHDNVAVGFNALTANSIGFSNTALGSSALATNTIAPANTAVGTNALTANTAGAFGTALGFDALQSNTTGPLNTAIGANALQANTGGGSNTAVGENSLKAVTTASNNTAIGVGAGLTNTVINGTSTTNGNTFLGAFSGPGQNSYQVSNSTAIGLDATVNQNNTIILGCTNGINSCTATPNVGIGSQYAPNALTVSPGVYGTNGNGVSNGSATTISESGTTGVITGSGTTFTSGMVGGSIYYSDGTRDTISAFTSTTSITATTPKTVAASSTYTIVYGGFNVTGVGTALLQPASDSTSVFKVQNATNTTTLLDVDTTNTRIGIGTAAPSYSLDVVGDINAGSTLKVGGVTVCTSAGCTAAANSGTWIQNGTAQQTANFNIVSSAVGNVGAVIQGASGQTADLLQVKGGTGNNVVEVGTGFTNINVVTTFSAASATALRLKSSNTGAVLLNGDTSNTAVSNLDTNGGIESGVSPYVANGTGSTVAQDATANNAYEGLDTLSVVTTSSATANAGAQAPLALASSTTYSLSFFAKLPAGSTAFTTLAAGRADNGSTNTACTLNSNTVTTYWQRYSCTFTTGTTSGSPYFFIGQSDAGVAHSYYLDSIQIIAASAPTTYREGLLQLNGVVTSPSAFQNASNSTTAFQIQNAALSTTLFNVDTATTKLSVNGQLAVTGGLSTVGLGTPSAPTVTPTGGSGATSYSYTITALNANGGSTLASTAGTTSTGVTFASLSSSVFNAITWNAVPGASSYNIYRTVGGTSQGLIGNLVATNALSFSDTGLAGSGASATTDNSGQFNATGTVLFKNAVNSTSAFLVQNSSGASVFNVDTTNSRVGVGTSIPNQTLTVVGSQNFRLPSPSGVSATPSASGGTLATNTYFYKVTGLDGASNETNVNGSTEVSAAVTGPTGSVLISWANLKGALGGYNIYRGTSAGGENIMFSVAAGVTSFTDIGTGGSVNSGVTTSNASVNFINGAAAGGNSYFNDGNVGIGNATPGNLLSIGALTTAAGTYQIAVGTGGSTNSGIVIQTVAGQSSGNILQAQDSTGAALATIDYQGNLTVKAATINGTLTVNGHVITGNTSGSTTAAVNANAGTGGSPACSVTGNDTGGQITLTTGTSAWASGTQCTITFASVFGSAPHPVISNATNVSASAVGVYVNSTVNTFTVNFINADTTQHTYTWNYFNAQ